MRVEFEGTAVVTPDRSIYQTGLAPGDLYVAKRNTGWKLLTCREVVRSTCLDVHGKYSCQRPTDDGLPGHPSFVCPVETAYAFDAWECFKVLAIE